MTGGYRWAIELLKIETRTRKHYCNELFRQNITKLNEIWKHTQKLLFNLCILLCNFQWYNILNCIKIPIAALLSGILLKLSQYLLVISENMHIIIIFLFRSMHNFLHFLMVQQRFTDTQIERYFV